MKTLNRSYKYLFILAFVGVSCTERMDISLDSTYTHLVVDAEITTDTMAHCVHLANSADYFYNQELSPVTGADVKVTDGTDTLDFTEKSETPGYYYSPSDFYGIAGRTYTLLINNIDINADGETEKYYATSYLPPVATPDSINVLKAKVSYFDYEIMFYGQDPADTHDYYMFKLRRNNVMLTDTLTEASYSDDEMYNGLYLSNISVYSLFKSNQDQNIVAGDTLTLEFSGITKGYFKFLDELRAETQGSSPMGGQPANLSTNFNDADMVSGFFSAYSIKRVSHIVRASEL